MQFHIFKWWKSQEIDHLTPRERKMPLPVVSVFFTFVCLTYLDQNCSKQELFFFLGICAVSSPQFRSEVKLLNQLTTGNGFLEGETWQAHNKCENKVRVVGRCLCFQCCYLQPCCWDKGIQGFNVFNGDFTEQKCVISSLYCLLRLSGSRQHTDKLSRDSNELFSNGTVCNITSKLSKLYWISFTLR